MTVSTNGRRPPRGQLLVKERSWKRICIIICICFHLFFNEDIEMHLNWKPLVRGTNKLWTKYAGVVQSDQLHCCSRPVLGRINEIPNSSKIHILSRSQNNEIICRLLPFCSWMPNNSGRKTAFLRWVSFKLSDQTEPRKLASYWALYTSLTLALSASAAAAYFSWRASQFRFLENTSSKWSKPNV